MKAIRSFVLFLGILGLSSALNADFFAYQLWVHPETKQHIHLFSDIHISHKNGLTRAKQQADFAKVIRANNGLGLVEDMETLIKVRSPFLFHFNKVFDKATWLFDAIQRTILQKSYIQDETPLSGLTEYCEQHRAPCINIDDRYPDERTSELDDKFTFRIDQNIKDKIQQYSKTKHIFVATGAAHTVNISLWLRQQGYKQIKVMMHKKLYELSMSENRIQYLDLQNFLSIILHDSSPPIKHFEAMISSLDWILETLIVYPLDIEALFQPENGSNPMISFDLKVMQMNTIFNKMLSEIVQEEIIPPFQHEITKAKIARATTAIKTATAISATLSTAALLYKKKPKPAAVTAAVGAGLYWAADRIAQWWYS